MKVLAVALSAAVVVLGGCGDHDRRSAAPASSVHALASSEPTADTSGEVQVDGEVIPQADITLGKFTKGSDPGVPGASGIDADFTIHNSASYAATFHLTFAIFDGKDTQVCGWKFDTEPKYGPTLAGKSVHVGGSYIADCVLPATFTVQVTEAQRVPA